VIEGRNESVVSLFSIEANKKDGGDVLLLYVGRRLDSLVDLLTI
jgi:hypothetical protein